MTTYTIKEVLEEKIIVRVDSFEQAKTLTGALHLKKRRWCDGTSYDAFTLFIPPRIFYIPIAATSTASEFVVTSKEKQGYILIEFEQIDFNELEAMTKIKEGDTVWLLEDYNGSLKQFSKGASFKVLRKTPAHVIGEGILISIEKVSLTPIALTIEEITKEIFNEIGL